LYNLIQKVAWLFAIVFGAVGVLGFVPGLTTEGHLLGIFEVDTIHNVIHLLSGAAAAFAASQSKEYSVWYFKIFGAVYALVTIIGFVQGTTVLGLIGVNMADNVLHLAIAAAALGLGFCPCGACPMCKIRTSDQPTA
jgi:hypothetical protein